MEMFWLSSIIHYSFGNRVRDLKRHYISKNDSVINNIILNCLVTVLSVIRISFFFPFLSPFFFSEGSSSFTFFVSRILSPLFS